MGKKNRARKDHENKNGSQLKRSNEKDKLLQHKDKSLRSPNKKHKGAILTRVESKVNTNAPKALETDFEDYPVLTICPFCEQKIVTKTHFDKKKPVCFCCCICCHPKMPFIFKDVIHSCPKCNEEIATFNRFLFCFGGLKIEKIKSKNDKKSMKSAEDIPYEKLDEEINEEYSMAASPVKKATTKDGKTSDSPTSDYKSSSENPSDNTVNKQTVPKGKLHLISSDDKNKIKRERSKTCVVEQENNNIELDNMASKSSNITSSSTSGFSSNSENSPNIRNKKKKRLQFTRSKSSN